MPTEIKQLKENGVEFYPVTVGEAVMIDNNTTVSSKIVSLESNSGNSVKHVAQSLTEEQQMQARKNQGLYYTEEGEGEATLTFDGDLTNATLMYEYNAYAENNIDVEEEFGGRVMLFAKISDKVAENILAARADGEYNGEPMSEEMSIDQASKIECDNYYYIGFGDEDYGIINGYIVVVQENNTTVSVLKEDGTDVMSISGVDKGIYVAVMCIVENSQLTPMMYVSSVTYFGEAEINHKIPAKYIDSNINIEGTVKYNTSQNLTDEQKTTARKNQGLYTDEILSFETGINWDAETISAESVIVYNKNYTQWQFYKVGELNNVNIDLLLNPELKSVFTINNSNYENLNLNAAKNSFTNWEWTIEGGTCVMFGTRGDVENSYLAVFIADNFELSKEGSNLTLNGIYCTYGVDSFKILYPINKIDKKYLNIDVYEERSLPEEGMLPNTPYKLGVIVDDTSFVLEKGIDGLFNHYFWTFDIKNIVPEITWPESIELWDDDEPPIIEAYKHYEISVYNNIAMYAVIDLPEPDLSTPLSFDILSDGTVVWNGYNGGYGNTIEYSKDRGITWNSITYSWNNPVNIDVKKGDTISFRGDNVGYVNPQQQTTRNYFNIYAKCTVYGNIMSLIDSSNFSTLKTISSNWAFSDLFSNNDRIIDASKLLLPATTLSVGCYADMFFYCRYLITPPELPATTLAESCYNTMFARCIRLTSAPELPATNLAAGCYKSMFSNCENLTTAPELPAQTLYVNCYDSMFKNCTKLTKAPDLLALSGTGEQSTACYRQMFYGCTRLREARCLIANANDMYQMFYMCGSTGTLIKHPNVTLLANTVPSTWTVIDDTSIDIPT